MRALEMVALMAGSRVVITVDEKACKMAVLRAAEKVALRVAETVGRMAKMTAVLLVEQTVVL